MESKGYTTKEAIENYLLIEIDDSFDTQVDDWIKAAEKYIDNSTNKDFTPGDVDADATDRTFDGDGTNTITIDSAISIEEIRFSETGDPIDVDQYVLYPVRNPTITKIKLKYLNFPTGNQNIYIKANWGVAEVPADIQLAATVIASGIIQSEWQSEGEVASMSIGRYSVTYKTKSQVDDFNKIEDILSYNKRYSF